MARADAPRVEPDQGGVTLEPCLYVPPRVALDKRLQSETSAE